MAQGLFRDKSLERITSPEQLNDYLKVTKPAVWAVLISVILLLAGFIVWGGLTYISSSVKGTADVKNGIMTVHFEDDNFTDNIQEGMKVNVGDTSTTITYIGHDSEGMIFARAETVLEDGSYQVKIQYKTTQILDLLLGN